MPLFEYVCNDCGNTFESLVFGSEKLPDCRQCGSPNITKLISAHSSRSGVTKNSMPGLGDTTCCGSAPGEKAGCAGPGSCCGKNFT